MLEHNEKRDFIRMDTNCKMKFKKPGAGSFSDGTCLDLSGAGIRFESSQEVEVGKALEICITPEREVTPPLEALIEVIRCEPLGETKWEIAASIKGIKGN